MRHPKQRVCKVLCSELTYSQHSWQAYLPEALDHAVCAPRFYFKLALFLTFSPVQSSSARTLPSTTRSAHTLPSTTASALDLIRSQPSQYVVATVAGRKYLLSPRDVLTVPRLKDVNVGDVVALSDIHELGSREYTLRGNPVISSERVSVSATVIEHTKGAQEVVVKRKRRKG